MLNSKARASSITGEGRLDTQTRTGKAPAEVAIRARDARDSVRGRLRHGASTRSAGPVHGAAVSLEEIDRAVDRDAS